MDDYVDWFGDGPGPFEKEKKAIPKFDFCGYTSYEDWYDNGPGSESFKRSCRPTFITKSEGINIMHDGKGKERAEPEPEDINDIGYCMCPYDKSDCFDCFSLEDCPGALNVKSKALLVTTESLDPLKGDIQTRKGVFSIDSLSIESYPDVVTAIMGHMIIVRCEMMSLEQRYEYHAMSDLFDVCEEGMVAPAYDILSETTDGKVHITAERVRWSLSSLTVAEGRG